MLSGVHHGAPGRASGRPEWRATIREHHSPLGDRRGRPGRRSARGSPGYGATTDALTTSVPRLSAVEIDAGLAATLRERFAGNPAVVIVRRHATALELPDSRYSGAASFTMLHHVPTAALQDRLFAEVARVLPPGAPSVASDSLPSPEIVAGHEGGTYNPVDPRGLARAPGRGRIHQGGGENKPIRVGVAGQESVNAYHAAPPNRSYGKSLSFTQPSSVAATTVVETVPVSRTPAVGGAAIMGRTGRSTPASALRKSFAPTLASVGISEEAG